MSVVPQANSAVSADPDRVSSEASEGSSGNRNDYQVGRVLPLCWPGIRGLNIEREILVVQWALPLVLIGIILVYEVTEHFITEEEAFPSADFLGEVFFFGILGPIAVWLVLRWIRHEWQERERDKRML